MRTLRSPEGSCWYVAMRPGSSSGDDGRRVHPGVAACLRAEGYSIANGDVGPGPERDRSGSSVLIFEVDAAGIDGTAAPARGCDVRFVGVVPETRVDRPPESRGRDLSAVLVLKKVTSSRLLSCVRAVRYAGGAMPPEVLCQMLAASRARGGEGAPRDLTEREFDVLRLLADGDSTRDIAKRMSYSERTVKNIVHDLLAKLNCRTRAHAVALATRYGVI